MSRNTVTLQKDGNRFEIAAGWDRPLKDFFLSVFPMDESDSDEDVEDPTLDQLLALEDMQFRCGADIGTALATCGMTVPAAMVQAIDEDFFNNAGNVMRSFSPSGELLASQGLEPSSA